MSPFPPISLDVSTITTHLWYKSARVREMSLGIAARNRIRNESCQRSYIVQIASPPNCSSLAHSWGAHEEDRGSFLNKILHHVCTSRQSPPYSACEANNQPHLIADGTHSVQPAVNSCSVVSFESQQRLKLVRI